MKREARNFGLRDCFEFREQRGRGRFQVRRYRRLPAIGGSGAQKEHRRYSCDPASTGCYPFEHGPSRLQGDVHRELEVWRRRLLFSTDDSERPRTHCVIGDRPAGCQAVAAGKNPAAPTLRRSFDDGKYGSDHARVPAGHDVSDRDAGGVIRVLRHGDVNRHQQRACSPRRTVPVIRSTVLRRPLAAAGRSPHGCGGRPGLGLLPLTRVAIRHSVVCVPDSRPRRVAADRRALFSHQWSVDNRRTGCVRDGGCPAGLTRDWRTAGSRAVSIFAADLAAAPAHEPSPSQPE